MPIYEFYCESCDAKTEVLLSMKYKDTSNVEKCPVCQKILTPIISQSTFKMKGKNSDKCL